MHLQRNTIPLKVKNFYKVDTKRPKNDSKLDTIDQLQNSFRIIKRPIKIIRAEDQKDSRYHKTFKSNTRNDTRQPMHKKDKAVDHSLDNKRFPPTLAEISTQTDIMKAYKNKNIDDNKGTIPLIVANDPILSTLRKCKCFACYHKYINSMEGMKHLASLTPIPEPISIKLPSLIKIKKTALSKRTDKFNVNKEFNAKRMKSPCINPLNEFGTYKVKKGKTLDWGHSKLFKKICNDETDIWNDIIKKQILTEGEVSNLLSFSMKNYYKELRPKLESTLRSLCKNLNLKFKIDKKNISDVRS